LRSDDDGRDRPADANAQSKARKEDNPTILFEGGARYCNLAEGEITTAYDSKEKHREAIDVTARLGESSSRIRLDNRGHDALREPGEGAGGVQPAGDNLDKISPRTVLKGFKESRWVDLINTS